MQAHALSAQQDLRAWLAMNVQLAIQVLTAQFVKMAISSKKDIVKDVPLK